MTLLVCTCTSVPMSMPVPVYALLCCIRDMAVSTTYICYFRIVRAALFDSSPALHGSDMSKAACDKLRREADASLRSRRPDFEKSEEADDGSTELERNISELLSQLDISSASLKKLAETTEQVCARGEENGTRQWAFTYPY